MIGDAEDVSKRLRLTLPVHWFADSAPVLDGLLSGLSSAWATLFNLLQVVRAESRISTADADFLDLAAADYFGLDFARRSGEADNSFRNRLKWALQRKRVTRGALVDVAAQAGFTLRIFEPAQPGDTGAYNTPAGLAWNVSGGWGSLQMPFECLITAARGPSSFDAELWRGIAEAMPAGGAAWLRIES